jgi:hypothetical protein
VLEEVEVSGGEARERLAQAADGSESLQEDFGENDGRAAVEINAAAVKASGERGEEAEVAVAGGTESGAVGAGVDVEDVGAEGEVDGEGNAVAAGLGEKGDLGKRGGDGVVVCGLLGPGPSSRFAGLRIKRLGGTAKKPSGSLTQTDLFALSKFGEFVQQRAGFFGEAEAAAGKLGFDVFRGAAGQGDFKVVDESGAGGGDAADEAAAHEVDEHGSEASLDDVAAEAPEDGFLFAAGGEESFDEAVKVVGGEKGGERLEKVFELGAAFKGFGEVARGDLGGALGERLSFEAGELERVELVDGFHRSEA